MVLPSTFPVQDMPAVRRGGLQGFACVGKHGFKNYSGLNSLLLTILGLAPK